MDLSYRLQQYVVPFLFSLTGNCGMALAYFDYNSRFGLIVAVIMVITYTLIMNTW